MSNFLQGKVAIVTGSGQGVGRAVAKALAAEGAMVVTNSRAPGGNKFLNISEAEYDSWAPERQADFDAVFAKVGGDAETTAQQIRNTGAEAVACFGDITKWEVGDELVKCAVDHFGTVDILINVAGAFGHGGVEDVSEELYDSNNDVKPKGYFQVIRAVVPIMKEKHWGRIINCTSRAWQGDVVKFTQYCTCNAGVVGLTRGLALELKKFGITCNAFSPHSLNRIPLENAFKEAPVKSSAIPGMAAFPPSGETPPPEFNAPFLCWLCTDRASKVSGTVFSFHANEISIHQEPTVCATIGKPAEWGDWTQEELLTESRRRLFLHYKSIVLPDIPIE